MCTMGDTNKGLVASDVQLIHVICTSVRVRLMCIMDDIYQGLVTYGAWLSAT